MIKPSAKVAVGFRSSGFQRRPLRLTRALGELKLRMVVAERGPERIDAIGR